MKPLNDERGNIYTTGTPVILLVDDEKKITKILGTILKINGIRYEITHSLKEAKRKCREKSFGVIFLDLGLPDGSGFSILDTIVEENREAVITVITGEDNVEVVIKSIRMGAFDFITKPFSLTLFQERLESAINEWRARTFTRRYQKYLERMVNRFEDEMAVKEIDIEKAYNSTVIALGRALDLRYPETEEHCNRVARISECLGKEMGLNDEELKYLKWGAYLHDIGKIGVPESILQKKGPLTEEEMAIVKKHPRLGFSMIENIDFLYPTADIILLHHEWWNGNGYPLGLKMKQIPLGARIFSVIDAFDSMMTDRPYRPALSYEETLYRIYLATGTQFDPEVVDQFFNIVARVISGEDYYSYFPNFKEVKKNGNVA
ncbi:MAG: HD domain-containing phosphohydrolase [Candidatus Hodarchaeales archaeon]